MTMRLEKKLGTFVLPYAAHKAASPIRFPPVICKPLCICYDPLCSCFIGNFLV
uniref:Uncharacterized protein n=1 Tax=Nelumbo nucifera TaxID=4432 RepID=A0A822ZTZ2_NELNU|nr:TPA_asm: hypothetical protein HUJ06_018360 [Nelumbo nucifera]